MNETLIAKKSMFYRHRALTAGQTFVATPIDAQYFARRGDAEIVPRVSAVIKAEAAPQVLVHVAAEVITLSPAQEVKEPEPMIEAAPEQEVDAVVVAEVAAEPEPEPASTADVAAPAVAEPAVPRRGGRRTGMGARS
jgi:hypothetical protein